MAAGEQGQAGMERAALIEALAAHQNALVNDTPWEALTEGGRAFWRRWVMRNSWPLIVAFVGDWLEDTIYDEEYDAATNWRETMEAQP